MAVHDKGRGPGHLSRRSVAAPFNPLTLFSGAPAGAWYDPSDLTTLFQDSAGTTPVTANSDPVGKMLDKSGNGNHLTQSTTTMRPLYKTSGGLSWLEFDGVDDWMVTDAFTANVLPYDRITALQQVAWTINAIIFGMGGSGGTIGRLYQNASTPALRMLNSGAGILRPTNSPAIGTSAVITERFISGASLVTTNNDAYPTAVDIGAGTGITFSIGNATNGLGIFSNFRFYGGLFRSALTDAQITSLRTYLGAKCGVVL